MANKATTRQSSFGSFVIVEQAVWVLLLICMTAALAALHLAALSRPLFLVGAVLLAFRYIRSSPFAYVTLTLWFWSLAPLARRLIDFYDGFKVVNVVLVTPEALCLFMVWDILTSKVLLRRREAAVASLAVIAIGYGLIVSMVRGDLLPGAVAASDWICPVAYYLYFVAHADRIEEAEGLFQYFVPLNLSVVAIYGLYQYANPLPWDVRWVIDSGMTSVGIPIPYSLKPFSTLNSPGICAVWLAAFILLSLHFRKLLTLAALPAALLLLSLTLVRSVTAGTVLGFLIAMLLGRGAMVKAGMVLLLTIVVAAASITLFVPSSLETVLKRFDTVNHLEDDQSARDRTALYASAPSWIAAHPLGVGIGAVGRGAVAAEDDSMVSIDSGPIAIYLSLGWVAGSLYLVSALGIAALSLKAAVDSRSAAALVLAAIAVSGSAIILFTNIIGVQGVLIWLSAGYATAIDMRGRRFFETASVLPASV